MAEDKKIKDSEKTNGNSKNSAKILLVDDDAFLLGMYALKFKESGFHVLSSTAGSDALDKLRNGFKPDVILLDIIMPEKDGFQVVEELRKEKLSEKSKIIFLTNNSNQEEDKKKAKDLQVDGFIVKASSIPSEVVEEVKGFLNIK